jgi:hypothetical protein
MTNDAILRCPDYAVSGRARSAVKPSLGQLAGEDLGHSQRPGVSRESLAPRAVQPPVKADVRVPWRLVSPPSPCRKERTVEPPNGMTQNL